MSASLNISSSKFIPHKVDAEQKIKAKKAAYALLNHVKNGSPKIKNLIREQCKLRIKQSRLERFEQSRMLNSKHKMLLTDLLRLEVAEIEKDIEMQDLIFKEILEEAENWFIEELGNQLNNQEKYLVEINEQFVAFCPICEKSQLELRKDELKCSCGISFSYRKSLENFVSEVHDIIHTHELQCEKMLSFYVEPANSEESLRPLTCICFDCDYFRVLS
ncbi:RIP-like protein [Condylostylus longicornis]|uniref:RIP-like protein n=1 Tax=Condylostylus longicornis TaxID=2530218 RepID=UPI00244DB42E|nr:RIP-like protein [Condylostylus longicornis]